MPMKHNLSLLVNKRLIAGLVICAVSIIAGCQPKAKVEEKKAKVEEEIEKKTVPHTYICHQAQGKIKIDGLLEEADWKKAPMIKFYHLGDPQDYPEAESPTYGKLLWDKDFLYISFEAFDKDIWGYYIERDESTCREDVLEIFIKPDTQRESYYNFEINALGTVYDAFNFKRHFAGGCHRWNKWNCEGLRMGIKIKGSLNNWKDEDKCWQLEVAIPFSAFKEVTPPPELGDEWSFALCRYDYSVYLEKGLEYSSTAKLSKINFHLWEDYDKLLFQK